MKAWIVKEGQTLAANGVQNGLAHQSFNAGQRIPDMYVQAIGTERLAELQAAGVVYSQDVPDPVIDTRPKFYHVAKGHSLRLKDGTVLPEHMVLEQEHVTEMHPNRLAQLVEAGTIIATVVEKGGAA